jgi:hypothetical protein
LPVATVPIFFSLQQMAEGFVWRAMDRNESAGATAPALVYLFFALGFWPFWPSFCANFLALDPLRRWIARGLAVVNLAWTLFLFGPIASAPDRYLAVQVVHHSLHYEYSDLPIYGVVPRPVLRLLYLAAVLAPVFLGSGSNRAMKLLALIVLVSILVAYLFFAHAFISVWCFFAAVISAYLCYFFRQHAPPGHHGE